MVVVEGGRGKGGEGTHKNNDESTGIGLLKCVGVFVVHIGDTTRRMIMNIMYKITQVHDHYVNPTRPPKPTAMYRNHIKRSSKDPSLT